MKKITAVAVVILVSAVWADDVHVNLADGDSIQETIEANLYPIYNGQRLHLHLDAGRYAGYTTPFKKWISVHGQGPDKTFIVDNDQSRPYAIFGGYWDYSDLGEKAGNLPDDEDIFWALEFDNLSIINGPGKRAEHYGDAAVFFEWNPDVRMENVVIISQSNNGLVVNYQSSFLAKNCVFLGTRGIGLAMYNDYRTEIQDCVISGFEQAFIEDFENGFSHCLFNCPKLGSRRDPETREVLPWDLEIPGMISQDPEIVVIDYEVVLRPWSPCLGAGTGGGNIGLAEPAVNDPGQGDLDGNKVAEARDVQLAVNAILGIIPANIGDVDGDGITTAVDLQQIVQNVLKGSR